jgi:hypothetical protein
MIFRYVPHEKAHTYALLGWHIADLLNNTPHGQYCILMAWLCECAPVEPKERRQ